MTGHVVIIGAGCAGVEMAASLRREGYDGPIKLLSEEQDPPYHRPPLSKSFPGATKPLKADKFYRDNHIELRLGVRASGVDRHSSCVLLEDGGEAPFSTLVLAVGVKSRRLRVAGYDLSGVHYLRTLPDARRLSDAVDRADAIAIIGGGFIGMEIAAALSLSGKQVTLLEAAARVMERSVSPLVSRHVVEMHEQAGVRIRTSTAIAGFVGDNGRIQAVELSDGERIAANLAIVAVGAAVDIAPGLMAGQCSAGIAVGGDLRVGATSVYAIGDCALFPYRRSGRRLRLESVQNAVGHARHAARMIVGRGDAPYADLPWFWSDQGGVKLQMAGLSLDVDRHVVGACSESGGFSVYNFCGEELRSVDSVNRPDEHMLARRLLERGASPTKEQIAAGKDALKSLLKQ